MRYTESDVLGFGLDQLHLRDVALLLSQADLFKSIITNANLESLQGSSLRGGGVVDLKNFDLGKPLYQRERNNVNNIKKLPF